MADNKKYGVCRFCGQQTINADNLKIKKEADRDEDATRHCSCKDATEYNEQCKLKEQRFEDRATNLLKAQQGIADMFGDKCKVDGLQPISGEQIQLLESIVQLVIDEKIHGVTVDINGYMKAVVKMNAKSKIIIERKDTEKILWRCNA